MPAVLRAALAPSAAPVDDEKDRARYAATLMEMWGVRAMRPRFLGCHPNSLGAEHLPALRANPHVVSLKTDGVRQMLLLTTRADGAPVALMIDRALAMREVRVWGPVEYFEGSLFDGELVWRGDAVVSDGASAPPMDYLVFDALCLRGKRRMHQRYSQRMQAVHASLGGPAALDEDLDAVAARALAEDALISVQRAPHALHLLPKPCAPAARAREVWAARDATPYRCDGLLFSRTDARVERGTSNAMLKWKPVWSVDLLTRRGEAGELSLHAVDPGTGGLARVPGVVEPNEVLAALPDAGAIVEYHVLCGRGGAAAAPQARLVPARVRGDKDAPNALRTVRSTMELAAGGVGEAALLRAVGC